MSLMGLVMSCYITCARLMGVMLPKRSTKDLVGLSAFIVALQGAWEGRSEVHNHYQGLLGSMLSLMTGLLMAFCISYTPIVLNGP